MNHMTISEFRANLPSAIDTIRKTAQPMLVTQASKEPFWVIPHSQFPPAGFRLGILPQNDLDIAIMQADTGMVTPVDPKELRKRALAAMKKQKAKKPAKKNV